MANENRINQFLDTVQTDQVVAKWIRKWEQGCLLPDDIHNEWVAWLPEIADRLGDVTNPLEPFLRNSPFGEVFVTILEKFIFYGYSTNSIDEMRKSEESSCCNKTTTLKESVYSIKCEECQESFGHRALCPECFENSEHRGHRYSMFLDSAGYCCCGEKGTWENTWYCTKHSELSHEDSTFFVPSDVKNRAAIVFEMIILYIDVLLHCYKHTHIQTYEREDLFYNITFYGDFETFPEEFNRLLTLIVDNYGGSTLEYQKSMVLNGTATIKLSKRHCQAIALEYESNELQIKAAAFHITDVIHQNFVWNLLIYLRKCLRYGRRFRRIFSELMLTKFDLSLNPTVAEHFLTSSSKLPSGFRRLIGDLLVIGMMKEYKNKESLARMIFQRYDVIINSIDLNGKEIADYLLSIKNQLFAVPGLSHKLVTNENALSVILTEVLKDSKENYEELEEDYDFDLGAWKRWLYNMNVTKMLLRSVPKVWTKELREGFINGLVCFVQVLNILQGIDSGTRKTGDHVDYEVDDYETKVSWWLVCTTSLILQWCESDKEIFGVALEETLRMVNQRISLESYRQEKMVHFLTYTARCLPYDSKIHSVSIYLPLYRFLVSLCVTQLENCDKKLLDLLRSKIFDSVLRIHAMLAQVTAGMWRRNGNSAEIRSDYYRGRSYSEIINRDIELLQIVASVTEPNEFLIEILEKYGLIDWGNPNFEENLMNLEEDEIQQVVVISEQFLQLLIMVMVERSVPEVSYVTKEDGLRNDIIHCLYIKPTSRSELQDYISTNSMSQTTVNSAIEEIANFRKPRSVNDNGTYELKPKLLERYNPLFYHYNMEEMTEAKEFQRERRKTAGEPDCFPPTELPELKEFFVPMVNVFQCDVMLHIMRTVLERFLDSESKSTSETQLENVLYLIGYALLEEKSGRYSELYFTARAAKHNLLDCLGRLLCSTRLDLPKDLVKWTIKKYKEVARVTNRTNEALVTRNMDQETEKLKRSQLALARRNKMIQQMTEMQKNFMNKNSAYHQEETETEAEETNNEETEKTCMLCKETQTLGLTNKVMVMVGLIQYSTVLCAKPIYDTAEYERPFLTSNLGPAWYTSSCGHVAHKECLLPHRKRSWNSNVTDYESGFRPKKLEFLCPLCESLCNVALPILLPLPTCNINQIKLSDDLKHAILGFTSRFQLAKNESPLAVWKSLSYTIHVIEALLRHSNKPILGHFSSRDYECLKSFVRISQVATVVYQNTNYYVSTIKRLCSLLDGDPNGLFPLLPFDIFGLLVTVVFSGIKFRGINRFHIFRLLFVAQIVKILMATNFDQMVDDVESNGSITPFTNILQILDKDLNHLSETFIWTYVKEACLPFLRRCVILLSFLTDVSPPVELTESGGDTFSNMCWYLSFPQTREDLFDTKHVFPYVQNWFKNLDEREYYKNHDRMFGATDPRHMNKLLGLPHEYFEIVRKVASLKCSNNDDKEVKDPFVCLVCGEIICTGFCCCQMINGQFSRPLYVHFKKCRSELYLRIDTCQITFQPVMARRSEGHSVPGPYLDEYHETDNYFIRGNPMYLSSEKYKELYTLWLSHGIYEKFSRLAREN